jgi:predicted deacylase
MRPPIPHPVLLQAPELSRWAASSTGVPYVHELGSGLPGPEVLLTALVHGNEYSGAIALDALLASKARPRIGRITVAFCNVAAFARFDPAHPDHARYIDEDFNRVWSPDRLDGTAITCELRRARALRPFVDRATHLLDLHSMHEPCWPLLVTGMLPRDVQFARQLQAGAQIVMDEGHADGMRMRDYPGGQAHSRISLLLEAGQHWQPEAAAQARDVTWRFLMASGVMAPADAPPGWLLGGQVPKPAVQVTHKVVARSMDFSFCEDYTGGEVIPHAGTRIASDAGEAVTTPYDDCVLVMPSVRQLRPGVTTVRLGRVVDAAL